MLLIYKFVTVSPIVYVLWWMMSSAMDAYFTNPQVPHLESTWWGVGNNGIDDTNVRPFKIRALPDVITDLERRLNDSKILTKPSENQEQDGINSNLLKKTVQYWITEYNWTKREIFLNQYPHFKTQIQGLQIHFIRVKPKVPSNVQVIPLLMLHGWPGSIREFYKVIPMLTTPRKNRNFVFEVIVPSLPGFGFSDTPTKSGCGAAQMGVIFNNLMRRLGYRAYYIQGGDWGSGIASSMAILYPTNVLGLHLNFCIAQTDWALFKIFIGKYIPSLVVSKEHRAKMYPISHQISSFLLKSGYLNFQSTKPDTIGISLNDSPSGLAAYILEKFITSGNPEWKKITGGGVLGEYVKTDLLDNIMIYWITETITTAMRIYVEAMNPAQIDLGFNKMPIRVPSACAKFPHETIYQPDGILKEKFYNLVQSTEFSRGGHFPALEEPKLLADDIWSAIAKMR